MLGTKCDQISQPIFSKGAKSRLVVMFPLGRRTNFVIAHEVQIALSGRPLSLHLRLNVASWIVCHLICVQGARAKALEAVVELLKLMSLLFLGILVW